MIPDSSVFAPLPPVSSAAPATNTVTSAAKASNLLGSLAGIASGLTGGLSGLASGALGSAFADVPMSATSGGSYIASGPTIGAKVIGGKGVSAGTSATQDATASNASGAPAVPYQGALSLNPSQWSQGTIAAVAVGVLVLLAILFRPSRGK